MLCTFFFLILSVAVSIACTTLNRTDLTPFCNVGMVQKGGVGESLQIKTILGEGGLVFGNRQFNSSVSPFSFYDYLGLQPPPFTPFPSPPVTLEGLPTYHEVIQSISARAAAQAGMLSLYGVNDTSEYHICVCVCVRVCHDACHNVYLSTVT